MKVEMYKIKCKRCGYEWVPRISDVRKCPKCQSYRWDQEKEEKGERKQKKWQL